MNKQPLQLFKKNWERSSEFLQLPITSIISLLKNYIQDQIEDIILLTDGCANSNYKITFTHSPPVLLRVYLRDGAALAKEQAILKLIKHQLHVPDIMYADKSLQKFPYTFAIMEFMPGKLMREVILAGDNTAIEECAYAAGESLAILRQINFPQAGFFQADLTIRPFTESEEYLSTIYQLLNEPTIKETLDNDLLVAINKLILSNMNYIPDNTTANLTHADYDPSNMLVIQKNGRWSISAVLDWEFALAGSYLLDIGLFLRYASQLPTSYESSFVKGIETNSSKLPVGWKKSAKLMDILCLLQLLFYHPKSQRPIMHHDIINLLKRILQEWPSYER